VSQIQTRAGASPGASLLRRVVGMILVDCGTRSQIVLMIVENHVL
jgi:hypothetical protein